MGDSTSINAALETKLNSLRKIISQYENVTELMVNSDGGVYLEASGKLIRHRSNLAELEVSTIIRLLAGHYNLVVGKENCVLEVRLPDLNGGRFEALVQPAVIRPCFSIRFPPDSVLTLDDLENKKTVTNRQGELLRQAVIDKKNILIAGGTGSGKTTVANALLYEIYDDRVLVVEDNPEIKLVNNANTDYYQTHEHFSLRDAVRVCMRMRPDRIIVGEMRDGGTAIDALKAWSTGHPGGIATIHAGSAEQVFKRLYTLMQEEIAVPSMEFIKDAIDMVVFVEKDRSDGFIRRRVKQILEVRQ